MFRSAFPKYLDKNHGGILIIWDRLFGTFQPEEDRPRYGLTRNIGSFNPFVVALKTWGELIRLTVKARNWRERARFLFGPPGWSPDGSSLTTRQLREQAGLDQAMLNIVNKSKIREDGIVRTK